jgi:hypothetical protein
VLKEIPSVPGRIWNLAKLHHFGAKNVAFEKCMDPKRVRTFLEVGYYKNTCNLETNRHPHNWET